MWHLRTGHLAHEWRPSVKFKSCMQDSDKEVVCGDMWHRMILSVEGSMRCSTPREVFST